MEGQQPLVSVNAPITVTVNGAPVGQEGAVAREVKRAMEVRSAPCLIRSRRREPTRRVQHKLDLEICQRSLL